jgi:hypothetical protein
MEWRHIQRGNGIAVRELSRLVRHPQDRADGVITYLAGGKQYVAAASGNTSMIAWRVTGEPTLVVYALP